MDWKRIGLVSAALVLATTAATACGNNNNASEEASSSPAQSSSAGSGGDEIVDVEVWGTNIGYKPVEKGSKLYEFYKEKLGVGVINPYVEWNGGTNYLNQLNLKIAANEMPDMFTPQQGIEDSLAKNGAIADLTELLPKYAPNVMKVIPEEMWDIVKANDPTGQGRIYYIPGSVDYGRYAGMIRQDWLDKLNLSMPQTQDEYVKVLEAFRDQDPNGNGQKDEIPTGGRQEARWMDHLFAMYGVAMFEGYPDWDLYNGELTYSAVTPNMKAALEFAAKLYKEGLLDPETLLNDKAKWDGKVNSDKAGNYFHWVEQNNLYLENLQKNTGVKGQFTVLPVQKVDGYEGFYTWKRVGPPQWVVKNTKDEKKLQAVLKLLNNMYDKNNWKDLYLGVEGMHYEMKDGKAVKLPDDKSTQENQILNPYSSSATLDFTVDLFNSTASADNKWIYDQVTANMEEAQKYAKVIAGDGLPASIYEGYADINNRTLYIEYASKIIMGKYPIDKFDEFVDKWNKSGGEDVTKRAREWYSKVKK
ncbi:ABC transporter substrate-binding protein [Cohnella thailandensis]|uniref:ABC transporter substrate-binding protein n=1 Tax=Cohnella thailandensis TaxID=557557 RepID=A0A841T0U2_9BACL|nr:ABC transporter substrate-binding protein [Cohnella thailandensis]MBB6637162.1 ABC transporter substrate-binding protein [Cohnella thailandensis]MBP1977020.1 putative aldouronate transport system substrate-binding protein [Cohnella thailandensis]